MPFASLLAAAVLAPAPTVGCAEHIEGPGAFPPLSSRDVVRGPLALLGGRELLDTGSLEITRPRPGHPTQVRLGVELAAGHRATVSIHPGDRSRAALQLRLGDEQQPRRPEDRSVSFVACASQTPRFGGEGTVGPRTRWAGGLLVRRAGCVRLRLTVDGAPQAGVRLALGASCDTRVVATASCANRSGAAFPGAFTRASNLVAGPLAIVGTAGAAGASGAATIRELGWWKSPFLVAAGRTVTVRVTAAPPDAVRLVGLGAHGDVPFARQPTAVRLVACARGERSGSSADGRPVTFWSGGFTVRRLPACAALAISVDGATIARGVRVAFGSPTACRADTLRAAPTRWRFGSGALERLLAAAPRPAFQRGSGAGWPATRSAES